MANDQCLNQYITMIYNNSYPVNQKKNQDWGTYMYWIKDSSPSIVNKMKIHTLNQMLYCYKQSNVLPGDQLILNVLKIEISVRGLLSIYEI